jgi:hypothetical protein
MIHRVIAILRLVSVIPAESERHRLSEIDTEKDHEAVSFLSFAFYDSQRFSPI